MPEAQAAIRITGDAKGAVEGTKQVSKSLDSMGKELRRLNGDFKKLESGSAAFKQTAQEIAKLKKEMQSLNQTASRGSGFVEFLSGLTGLSASSLGLAAVGTGLAVIGKQAITSASALEGMENRARKIFGIAFPQMRQEISALSNSLQRGEGDLLSMASEMGSLLKSAGTGGAEINKMSKQVVQLAVDFGSFYRIADEDAFETIRQAVMGQTKALSRLGFVMDDSIVEQYAFAKGIKTAWEEMSEAEQMAWRLQYVMSITTDVQGDATVNADNFANSVKEARAVWSDFLEVIGSPVLGYAADSLQVLTDGVRGLGTMLQWSSQQAQSLTYYLMSGQSMPKPWQAMGIVDTGIDPNLLDPPSPVKGKPPGGGGGKAKKEIYDVRKEMEKLGETYAKESLSISQNLRKLESDHEKSAKDIQKSIEDTKKKISELRKEYADAVRGFNIDESDAAASQSDRLQDMLDNLNEMRLDAEIEKIVDGSLSVKSQNALASEEAKYAKELEAYNQWRSSQGSEMLTMTDERSSQTSFERDISDIQLKREEESQALQDKLAEYEEELTSLDEKRQKEEMVYAAARQQYAATQSAFAAFQVDYNARLSDMKSQTETSVKAMIEQLKSLSDSMTVDPELIAESPIGQRVAERRSARIPALAEGGIVTRPTVALIGEAGPEAVVPLNKAAGGNITISAIHVHNEADEDRLIRKLARMIQLQTLQAA